MTDEPQPASNNPAALSPRTKKARRAQTDTYREGDITAEAWGGAWPDEAPVLRSKADRLRAEMVARPDEVVTLGWSLHDPARAARIAKTFRDSSNRRLPVVAPHAAGGTFEARHYWSPDTKTYRIAARYTLPHPPLPPKAPQGPTEARSTAARPTEPPWPA